MKQLSWILPEALRERTPSRKGAPLSHIPPPEFLKFCWFDVTVQIAFLRIFFDSFFPPGSAQTLWLTHSPIFFIISTLTRNSCVSQLVLFCLSAKERAAPFRCGLLINSRIALACDQPPLPVALQAFQQRYWDMYPFGKDAIGPEMSVCNESYPPSDGMSREEELQKKMEMVRLIREKAAKMSLCVRLAV